jgi:hypothetical protein
VVDKVALGQIFPDYFGFPLSISFHRWCITWKNEKKNIIFHLHHRVAQEALRLRCVSSICCGALLHKKNTSLTLASDSFSSSRGGLRLCGTASCDEPIAISGMIDACMSSIGGMAIDRGKTEVLGGVGVVVVEGE